MSIDLYVGTLTRYHSGDWETASARAAREMGMQYRIVRTDPDPSGEVTDQKVIQDTAKLWQARLQEGLQGNIQKKLEWNEQIDAPYFSDQINWYGYAGLVLLAAHTEYKEFPMPDRATPHWDRDLAFETLQATGFQSRFNQIFNVEMWLPADFPFVFVTNYLTGGEMHFGSAAALLKQLELLNQETVKANAEQLERWRTEGAGRESDFMQTARFGLALCIKYAKLALEHTMPMRLDY